MRQIGMSAAVVPSVPAPPLHDVLSWIDTRVRDVTGRRLGRVSAIVCDAQGTPWWIVFRHRGRDTVAPVAAVHARRHHEILLDRAAETLAPSPGEIDARAHAELVARFGLAGDAPAPAAPRRDGCTGRRFARLRRPRRRPR